MRSRQPITDLEQTRAALSCRGVEREYGLARSTVADLVRRGEIPGIRRGRSIRVLRTDIEAWWRRTAAQSIADADRVVDRVLEREARRAG